MSSDTSNPSATAPPILRTVLAPLTASDVLPSVAAEPLAHGALGGLYGAALLIARSPDPKSARAEVDVVVDTLIGGLRTSASAGGKVVG